MYIELRNVSKKIKNATILDNVNLRFEGGKVYGLKGKMEVARLCL